MSPESGNRFRDKDMRVKRDNTPLTAVIATKKAAEAAFPRPRDGSLSSRLAIRILQRDQLAIEGKYVATVDFHRLAIRIRADEAPG